jgi:hypothetical protein
LNLETDETQGKRVTEEGDKSSLTKKRLASFEIG